MILNQDQLTLLNNPKVKLIFQALDCEILDSQKETRRLISNRVGNWIEALDRQEHHPRSRSLREPLLSPFPSEEKNLWIVEQERIHGPYWPLHEYLPAPGGRQSPGRDTGG